MATKEELLRKAAAAFKAAAETPGASALDLARLSMHALWNGESGKAYSLARRAREMAPDDPEVRSMTDEAISHGVPKWHFSLMRDHGRNRAYEAALLRAVRPNMRVLDIGAGTGLLALIAARAGADQVVSCEVNRAVADAAAEIVALNGYSDRVRVVPKLSTDLDVGVDMVGPADLVVSEIVSNEMLHEGVLPVMEDTVARLMKPGARMIPSSGTVRVALAHWGDLSKWRTRDVCGFDVTPFHRLDQNPKQVKVGDETLALRSPPADLFEFDFASGGPFHPRRTKLNLVADGGAVNGIVQWIRLQLDDEGVVENLPSPGATSNWAALFYPIEPEIAPTPGTGVAIEAAHTRDNIRIWRSS